MNILGIDPGTNILGYGMLAKQGSKTVLIGMGVVKLQHLGSQQEKLQQIYNKIKDLIQQYDIHEMAIEAPFMGKNAQAMITLCRAQGVCLSAALAYQLPVAEYAPKSIKQAITGKGNASKEQVAYMLKNHFQYQETPTFLDATDALAIAMTHAQKINIGQIGGKKKNTWKEFIEQNPDRAKI